VTDNPVRRFGLIPRDEGTRTTFDLSVDSVFVSHVVEIFCELRIDGVLRSSPFGVSRPDRRTCTFRYILPRDPLWMGARGVC
jgi:hypothetical protein